MASVVLAMACDPTAAMVPAGDAAAVDGGGDAGRSVADWQSYAAGQWRGEMQQALAEMQGVIDRTSPNDLDAAGVEQFRAAMVDYRAIGAPSDPDASVVDRRAMTVQHTLSVIAPIYCRAAAAFRVAAPRAMLTRPAPRVACSELPPTGAWWERWP